MLEVRARDLLSSLAMDPFPKTTARAMGGRRLRTSAPPEVEALKGVLVSRLQVRAARPQHRVQGRVSERRQTGTPHRRAQRACARLAAQATVRAASRALPRRHEVGKSAQEARLGAPPCAPRRFLPAWIQKSALCPPGWVGDLQLVALPVPTASGCFPTLAPRMATLLL